MVPRREIKISNRRLTNLPPALISFNYSTQAGKCKGLGLAGGDGGSFDGRREKLVDGGEMWYNWKEMKKLVEQVKQIYAEDKWLFFGMVALIVMGLVLLVVSLVNLSPDAAVVKTGYSDIGSYQGGEWTEMQAAGGYRDGSWTSLVTFGMMAVILGIVHPLIAVKLYSKRGSGMAMTLVLISMFLIILTRIVLGRLLREG